MEDPAQGCKVSSLIGSYQHINATGEAPQLSLLSMIREPFIAADCFLILHCCYVITILGFISVLANFMHPLLPLFFLIN